MVEIKQEPEAQAETHSLFKNTKTTVTNNFRLYIDEFFNIDTDIHEIYNSLHNAGKDDTLELRISSPGGLVTECQQIVNIMWNKFNGRTTAYIDSHASSAGAFTFCSADKRVVYENSRLMLHNYSGGHGGKHQDMKDRMEFDEKHIIGFLKSTLQVGKNGFMTKKEFKRMVEGREFWWDAKEMCERGVATHVIVRGEELTAKEYLKNVI
jgi:ATP-dependent protease ClpP protease subunit